MHDSCTVLICKATYAGNYAVWVKCISLMPIPSPRGLYTLSRGTIPSPRGLYTLSRGTILSPRGLYTLSRGTILSLRGVYTLPRGTIMPPRGVYTLPRGTIMPPRGPVFSPHARHPEELSSSFRVCDPAAVWQLSYDSHGPLFGFYLLCIFPCMIYIYVCNTKRGRGNV